MLTLFLGLKTVVNHNGILSLTRVANVIKQYCDNLLPCRGKYFSNILNERRIIVLSGNDNKLPQ